LAIAAAVSHYLSEITEMAGPRDLEAAVTSREKRSKGHSGSDDPLIGDVKELEIKKPSW